MACPLPAGRIFTTR